MKNKDSLAKTITPDNIRVNPVSVSVLNLEELRGKELTPFASIDPSIYARDYLHSCYPKIPFHDEKLILDFLCAEAAITSGADSLLEVGCGPVISHALPFVPYVKKIVLSDYLESNLEQITAWLMKKPSAHEWFYHTELILKNELPGKRITAREVRDREESLRHKVNTVVRCDLLKKFPIGKKAEFPVVTCFYATEQACTARNDWFRVIENLGRSVQKGGLLFLSCLKNTYFYAIHDDKRNAIRIPIARINERIMSEALSLAGFDLQNSVIISEKVEGLEEEAIDEIILVRSLKKI